MTAQASKRPLFAATLLGVITVFMWGLSPVCGTRLKNVPIFQLTAITFALSGLVAVTSLSFRKGWKQVRLRPMEFLLRSVYLFLNQVCYFSIFRHFPPEQGELLYYTWPVFFALTAPNIQCRKRQIGAAALGFAGLAILEGLGSGSPLLADLTWTGFVAAAVAVSSWCLYLKDTQSGAELPGEVIGLYAGTASLLSLVCTACFAEPVSFSTDEVLFLLLAGVGTSGVAFIFWETGMRYGEAGLLSVLAFFVPLISVVLLILEGDTEPTLRIGLATLFITISAFLAHAAQNKATGKTEIRYSDQPAV